MGSKHVGSQEVPVPSSSSKSSGTERDEILSEKRNYEEERQDTVGTELDYQGPGAPDDKLALHRTHTHHLGPLHLRDVDDDDPS
jgi:hypothetical protein